MRYNKMDNVNVLTRCINTESKTTSYGNVKYSRVKKTFSLTNDEFIEGKWLNDLNKIFNYDKIDMVFKGNTLIIKFFKEEKNE